MTSFTSYFLYCYIVILGVTFDSKMTFEKHLLSVSRVASQMLGILRKSWQVFHDRLLLWRCFRGFTLPVLEYCAAVWCSAADTHLKLLDRVVSGASFLTGGVFECDLAHRRSVAVLCMLYRIRCTIFMHGALPEPYVPVCFIRGAVFDGVGLAGFKSRTNVFLLPQLIALFMSQTDFTLFCLILWFGIVLISLSQPCTANLFK